MTRTLRRLTRLLALAFLPLLTALLLLATPLGAIALGAATLVWNLNVQTSWTYTSGVTGLSTAPVSQAGFTANLVTSNGTAGTANLIYAIAGTIAASGNTVINVSATPVSDWFGTTIVMARIKVFFVNLLTTTTSSSIAVGNATAPLVNWISAGTATIKVNNGGIWLQGDTGGTGYPVTGTTADNLKILNNDGANVATYNLMLIGSTA